MKWIAWLGPAVFILSLAMRLVGIEWGLPNDLHRESYHPDEPINVHFAQEIKPWAFQLTPGFYSYGTFYLTLARIASSDAGMGDNFVGEAGPADEKACLLPGRIISALAGAGTAWVLFAILRRRTNLFGAVFGGLALGFAPAFVVHSRFYTVDVTATFLFALSLLFSLRLLPDQELKPPNHFIRWALLAGLFAGLSAGTKYTGGIAILGIYTAIMLSKGSDRIRLALIATGAAFVAFILSTPGVLFDTARFTSGFMYEVLHVSTGQGLVFVDTPPAAIEHVISLAIGLGFLVLALGGAGLFYAAFKKHAWALVVLVFALTYYLLISRGEVKYLRYTFPLYVPLAVGFGWLVGQAHQRKDNLGRVVVALGIFGIGIYQLVPDVKYAAWMSAEDPRDTAGRTLIDLANKHPGMTVGVTDDPWFYTPALYPDAAMSRPQWILMGLRRMQEARDPRVVRFTPDQKPDYVTYSSLKAYDLERLKDAKDLSPDNQKLIDDWKSVYSRLENEYVPFMKFGNADPNRQYREDLEYVQPDIFVWKRKDLR